MSILDFITVVSFGLTSSVSDTHSVKIIINHKNIRPSLVN